MNTRTSTRNEPRRLAPFADAVAATPRRIAALCAWLALQALVAPRTLALAVVLLHASIIYSVALKRVPLIGNVLIAGLSAFTLAWAPAFLGVPLRLRRQPECQHIRRIESRVDRAERRKASHHEHRPDEKSQRERHLCHHQTTADPLALAAKGTASSSLE